MMIALTNEQKLAYKQQLKDACISALEDRKKNIEAAMREAQEGANSEEKSSAGDKHETSRAMSHLNQEMNARQLEATNKELSALHALNVSVILDKVAVGAVVVSKEHLYFIAAGLGRMMIDGQKVTFLSPTAPLAVLMRQKQAGDKFELNGKVEEIVEVF